MFYVFLLLLGGSILSLTDQWHFENLNLYLNWYDITESVLFFQNISRKVQIAELAISRIQFLERQFNKLSGLKEGENISNDVVEFVSDLLSLPEVSITGGPRGKIGKMICKLIKDQVSASRAA